MVSFHAGRSPERPSAASRTSPTPSSPCTFRWLTERALWLGAAALVLAFASVAHAATYYIDASKSDTANCGTAAASACRTYRYWFRSGCDADGCGNNVVAGDTVYFRAGTYNGDGGGGNIGIPFNGSAAAPITVACMDTPGSCIIDGSGVSAVQWCQLVGIGLSGSSNCSPSSASYVIFQGFTVRHAPTGMYTVGVTSSSTHHVMIKSNVLDGTGANQNIIMSGNPPIHHVTVVNNTVTNCPQSASGCNWVNEVANMAVVGNAFGPVSSAGNYDCNTFVGVNTGLVDGNTCHDTFDGFDEGMNSSTKLDRVIVRYNEVYGYNTGRAFPISGNGASSSGTTGHNILYKNVSHVSHGACFQPYGGADGIDIWYNTVLAPASANWGDDIWLETNYDYWDQNIGVKYNIFDTTSTSPNQPVVLDKGGSTVKACPSGARCPFVKNGIWMAERGGSGPCVYWNPSDGGLQQYTCDQFATTFNSDHGEMSGNFRANPNFVNRSVAQILSNLKLTLASTAYIDKGNSFCHATSSGSGTSIAVSCDGMINDARYYFPDPGSFFGLSNNDCKGKGVRAADGIDSGCFDIQIQGCGVRQATSVSASSIAFSGGSCSWTSGAMVHIPWNGAAPDIGALEALTLPLPPPPAPTLISVVPLP
jgi:hypothetical protein